jgi:DNA-binding CsgD family transcriptional regulator
MEPSPVAQPDATPPLVGREAEIARVDAVLGGLPGQGAALVVAGEAGIGKSALIERARRRGEGVGARTLSTVGVESEAELGYAGLHQLLVPILELGRLLPEPQQRALDAAFGAAEEVESDRFLVAIAAFGLVCEAAGSAPLVLIADDAQWLDPPSLAVLAFIARRLESEPIALLFGVRDGYATPLEEARLPSLRLERIDAGAAAALLDRTAPGLPPLSRERVLAEAAGNPLALVELARVPPSGDPADESLTPPPTNLTARLEGAFASELDPIPPDTRLVLLAAALDGRAPLAELVAAASAVRGEPLGPAAIDPAVEARLVELDAAHLHFRHPLIRSAVRQAGLPGEVLALYAALAEVVADPERRLWHRAGAAVGFDEEIAAALEAQASDAQRRGAVGVAAAALERAAALSSDPRKKGRRLVRAAGVAYDLGLVGPARRLIRQAEPLELDPLEAARLAWLRQMISGDVWVQAGATRSFVAIAEQMAAGGDPDAALGSLVPIAHRSWWTRSRERTRRYLADTAEGMGFPADDPRLLAVIALAHPEGTAPLVRRRIAAMLLHEIADPLAAMHLGIAAEKAGDFVLGARFLAHAVDGLREQGRLGPLTQALVHHAWAATHTAEWETAIAAGAEAGRLAADTRQPQFGSTGALVVALATAHRGSDPDLESLVARPERALLAASGGPLLAPAHLARGADALGDGRHEDAFRHLWPVFDEADPVYHRFMRWSALLDLVEAGVGTEHDEPIDAAVAALELVAAESEPPYLVAALACARPLRAADEEAEALFEEALLFSVDYSFLRARTLFSFGRHLRRHRRSADSRTPLRESVGLFDALGATRWSSRARLELRATGETIGGRSPDARDRLTAQELQIAQLAAEGLSNREIGERLFLSHRTIGSHLYRIFPKLGITARAQLRDALRVADPSQLQSTD